MRDGSALMRLGGNLLFRILTPFVVDTNESGERHLYAATSGAYPAREEKSGGGIEASAAEEVKRGSNGVVGSGAYLLGWNGEVRANQKVLEALREKEAGKKIWEHTMETFRSVRG